MYANIKTSGRFMLIGISNKNKILYENKKYKFKVKEFIYTDENTSSTAKVVLLDDEDNKYESYEHYFNYSLN